MPNTRRYSASTARLSSARYLVISATSASCEHVFHVAYQRILDKGAVAHPPGEWGRKTANRRGDVKLFTHDPEPGLRDLIPEPRDPHLLEEVVVLDLSASRGLDEGVFVRRLPERPGCAAGE